MTTNELSTIGNATRIYKLYCKKNKKPFYKPSFTNSTSTVSGIVLLRDEAGFVAAVKNDEVLRCN